MNSPGSIFFKGVDTPPLGAASADNGLSFDTTTGKIVLGNDSTGAPGPAQLLSPREIFTNGNSIIVQSGTLGTDAVTTIAGNFLQITTVNSLKDVGVEPGLIAVIDNDTQNAGIELTGGAGTARFQNKSSVLGIGFSSSPDPVISIPSSENVLIGTTSDNNTKLQVNGIISVLMQTENLDFPNTAAQTSSDIAVTVNGALDGDYVVVAPSSTAIVPDSCYSAWVSNNDEVTIRFNNYSAAAQDPPAANFKITILKAL